MWAAQVKMAFTLKNFIVPFLFFLAPLTCHSTNSSSVTVATPSNDSLMMVRGCGTGLHPMYRYLCDRRAVWGIVLETLAAAGFLLSIALLFGLLVWSLCICATTRNQRNSIGGIVTSMSMFLLATAGIFALTFAFIIRLTSQTCPTRLFLFGVLFSLAFSCLLARSLSLLGFAAARGWGEPAVALGLFVVQVIIATQWLILVLVRDKKPCEYSQEEFVMLLIYVMCILAVSFILSLHYLCRSCGTYTYTGPTNHLGKTQGGLVFFTLLLSVCIWVVWITMLVRGNPDLNKRPVWDDPVISIALVANGWVLLLGHGLSQVAMFCRGEALSKDLPLSFAGWTSPSADIPELASPKEGRENGSYENDGSRPDQPLRSPYESEFSMQEIDTAKDYTIPRPKTTNYEEPYDDYYRDD